MYALARKQTSPLELALTGLAGTSKKTSVVVGKCRLSVGYKHGWLWLYGVHVSDEHRGLGYAALAMQELITVCDKLSIKIKLEAVPLDDDGDMKRLVGFYTRFGFRPTQSTEQAVVMERKPNKKGSKMSIHEISHKLAAAGVKHVVVSAFQKKEAVQTPEGWDTALDSFKDHVQKLQDAYIKAMDYTHLNGTKVSSEDALKFTKVFIIEPSGNKRIYCFIDRNNGDILKPATFSAPAKGARGNIFDADHGMKRMGPHGPAYNK